MQAHLLPARGSWHLPACGPRIPLPLPLPSPLLLFPPLFSPLLPSLSSLFPSPPFLYHSSVAVIFLPLPTHPFPPLRSKPLESSKGSGECCKLPQRGLGRSHSRNRIGCILALKSEISHRVHDCVFCNNQLPERGASKGPFIATQLNSTLS